MEHIYAIVRIPKSGSSSLEISIAEALAPRHLFKVPMLSNPDAQTSTLEAFRARKKKTRRIWKNFHVLGERSMWRKIRGELTGGDIVSGHFHYGRPELAKDRLRYITIIRNPLDRFLSEYKWVRFGYEKRWPIKKLYHFGRPAASALSMDDYLDYLVEHHQAYSNPAARYVCGECETSHAFEHLVENYWHFGLLEKPDAFARGFESKAGVPFHLRHVNTSPSASMIELSNSQRRKFEALHEVDMELYRRLYDAIR